MMNSYYSMQVTGNTADIDIYGDITDWPWASYENEVTAKQLSKQLARLDVGVDTINVHINSYGGQVAEGLAIYNELKRHRAKIVTTCDGFACSIASVIFMAGDERVMSGASMLMVHNAMTQVGMANAAELRKAADDIEAITQASKNAYMAAVSITEDELTALMDAETWLTPQEAFEMGFATAVESYAPAGQHSQSARDSLASIVETAMAARRTSAHLEHDGDGAETETEDGRHTEPAERPDESAEQDDGAASPAQERGAMSAVATLAAFISNRDKE